MPDTTLTSAELDTTVKAWSLLGYAPGNYMCSCALCGEQFTGDKRAVNTALPIYCDHCGQPIGSVSAWLAVPRSYVGDDASNLQHNTVRLHPQCVAPFQKELRHDDRD